MNTPLLEFRDVSREFTRFDGFFSRMAHRMGLGKPVERLAALQQINLQVRQGETLGIVGESGCGKTTLGRIAAQILGPSSGEVLVRGTPLSGLPEADARAIRTRLQMVFQNPYASLNPRRRIGDTIVEAALTHGLVTRANAIAARDAAMRQVGLSPEFANRFPHQLSGGQRQRVGIARALMVDPELVVFDEAVAALDVSIQAQILGVLQDLRKTEGFTSMFISHDLNVVRHISDRVAILYLGRVVEIAPTQVIFAGAHHPYARALLDEAPKLSTQKRRFSTIKGELPSPLNPPSGCHFHPRCPFAQPLCAQVAPQLREIGSGHHSACHIGDGLALPTTA